MYFPFAGIKYHSIGGMGDYQGGFDTIKEAKIKLSKLLNIETDDGNSYNWAHIATLIDGDYVNPSSLKITLIYDNGEWIEVGL